MNTEAYIRDRAALGQSREMVRQALGVSGTKFRTILEAMPDVKWPSFSEGLGRRLYRESVTGSCPDYKREALGRAREARRARFAMYDLCGISATISEHCQAWADCIGVTPQTVDKRLKQGKGLYDAFFAPPTPRSERVKAAIQKSPWRNRKEAS